MANYGYLYRVDLTPEAFRRELKATVLAILDKRWEVRDTDFEDEGPVWLVALPGTAFVDPEEVRRHLLAPEEDVGFPVALQDGGQTIAFRHNLNLFLLWAQGRVEEEMADRLGIGVTYDSTGETMPPGTRRRRTGDTFRDYLTRNLDKPLSAEDTTWLERFRKVCPEGHW